MQANVGSTDRIIRIVLGLAIIALGVIYASWWGALGLVLVVTGMISRCPAYLPLGLSTCGVKRGSV